MICGFPPRAGQTNCQYLAQPSMHVRSARAARRSRRASVVCSAVLRPPRSSLRRPAGQACPLLPPSAHRGLYLLLLCPGQECGWG